MKQSLSDLLRERVTDLTERYRQAGYFPSAVVRVFDRNETLAVVTAGGVSADAVFDVASLTKIATTAQVLLLIDAGRLALQDGILACLPELAEDPVIAARLRAVTIERLLTHTSSIDDWYPFYCDRGLPFAAVLRRALEKFPAVEGMVYSDLNFMLLGKLLERIHGKPLARCLQEELVQPLGLGTMCYRPDPALPLVPSSYGNPIEERMVADCGLSFDGWRPKDRPVVGAANDGNAHYYFDDAAGHAGIFATAEAYERLCRFFLTTDKPIFREAQEPSRLAPSRGLGLQTTVMYPHGCGHTGFTGTSLWISREKGLGAVAFTNRLFYPQANPNGTNDFRRALHETVLTCAEAVRR